MTTYCNKLSLQTQYDGSFNAERRAGAWGRNRTADTGIFSPLLLPAELPRHMVPKSGLEPPTYRV